ncbi:MAG: hypothetical protein FWC19_01090 [Treponema sp.]|nr:hypothetical protein [Treponema sp.]MCL2271388.1 hypothetical protein [Treponema sp.]
MMRDIPIIWSDEKETFNDDNWQKRREQIVNLLCKEEYGFLPPEPVSLASEIIQTDEEFCAGKAPLKKVLLHCTLTNGRLFTMPLTEVIPSGENVPFFVYISFSPNVPDKFLPSEEIADSGFGVLSFYYEDIVSDNSDFNNGLAEILGYKDNSACGKIALWVWAAKRAMDYAQTLPQLDKKHAAVAGHSRLGKTALLAGAFDTRFKYVISNNSGCCGAAISRGKKGERIKNITDVFPYWFKAGFDRYADKETSMPFDQHFLIAASAPRFVYVSSSEDDSWADPQAEAAGCRFASEAWSKSSLKGFVCDDEKIETGKSYHDGNIGYHIKRGKHFLGREDWHHFMKFINTKKN